MRPKKKKEKKKGPHLFWDEKLGNFSKIRKVHPENSEKFGKFGKIRKVGPENSEKFVKLVNLLT